MLQHINQNRNEADQRLGRSAAVRWGSGRGRLLGGHRRCAEVDGTGAGKGTYGWSGYHNTHFWIDPENNVYGLFMSRAIEFDFSILAGIKKASYEQLSAN